MKVFVDMPVSEDGKPVIRRAKKGELYLAGDGKIYTELVDETIHKYPIYRRVEIELPEGLKLDSPLPWKSEEFNPAGGNVWYSIYSEHKTVADSLDLFDTDFIIAAVKFLSDILKAGEGHNG
jgi:hypothetical protein